MNYLSTPETSIKGSFVMFSIINQRGVQKKSTVVLLED